LAKTAKIDTAKTSTEQAPVPRRNRDNLVEQAYECLENLLVVCELRPGSVTSLQDLQALAGFGRTPVHQAVNRLAADTLLSVQPRHGIRIAPIDLTRERMLLRLRRDLERFVLRLATERLAGTHRAQILYLARGLRERRETMTISDFNIFDRRLDRLVLTAAGEPFLEHTLRPLHTIFRRIGWIHHHHVGETSLLATIDCHVAVIEAVADRAVEPALEAFDELIGFVEQMFHAIEREVDPALLDSGLEPLPGG
jgi:DNA-binding GntR family transcriptional regulator